MSRNLQRALVVEDEDVVRRSLVRFVRQLGVEVVEASSVDEAVQALEPVPDLIVLDIRLADGSGFSVVEAALECRPTPLIVAVSGVASTEEAFRLAGLGVRAYLQKPVTQEKFADALEAAQEAPPGIDSLAASSVGSATLPSLQSRLRQAMVHQALALSGGNYSRAARMLGVSRQALQQTLQRFQRSGNDEGTAAG